MKSLHESIIIDLKSSISNKVSACPTKIIITPEDTPIICSVIVCSIFFIIVQLMPQGANYKTKPKATKCLPAWISAAEQNGMEQGEHNQKTE